MEGGNPQLVARELKRSFRMGPRRIEVWRGISMEVHGIEAVFLVGASGAAATESLRAVGLGERLQHLPAELSGGEQQRVAIARALVNDPAIVFADEPTGNLDSKSGEAIMDLLLSLARERKKTLLVVTHDPRLATLGDRQLHIADGKLEQSQSV